MKTTAFDSAREIDENGYITIRNNPISRAGVFPYLGSSIGADDPDKIYYVYRPAEELSDPACLASFGLIPLVDDHTMLGEGFTPAEQKGVHGTTADDVEFRENIMYATLRIFSETLADLIERGKKDLSLGYRCIYEKAAGYFGGQAYDYVQRSLRGNHIALVDEARCAVSVLDSKSFGFDHFDIDLNRIASTHQEKEKMDKQISLDEALKANAEKDNRIAALDAQVKELTAQVAKLAADADEEKKDDKAEDESEEEKKDKAEDADDDEKKDKESGMDAALVSATGKIKSLEKQVADLTKAGQDGFKNVMREMKDRNALADTLSKHVGSFDSADMTVDEVAVYGCDKLELKPQKGHERSALEAYLKGRTTPTGGFTPTGDSALKAGGKIASLDNYLNPKKA